VSFESIDALRREFDSNLSNGGIFVTTQEPLELRQAVSIRITLSFANEHVVLAGEVVHVVPPEMAGAGGTPGVALQLIDSPVAIRDRFAEFLDVDDSSPATEAIPGHPEDARRSPRRRARIEAQIAGDHLKLDGCTRDISHSGALVGVREDVAVGERVQLTLRHPSTDEELAVSGKVVRQVEGDEAGVSAVAIQFDPDESESGVVASFVNDVQRTEHARRMGGIAGPIEALGPHAVVQMFASTAPEGTLYLRSGQEEGVIGFKCGLLHFVRLGTLQGMEALVQLLRWSDGSFEFHARLETSDSREPPLPLEAAVLDAVRQIDESTPVDPARFPLHGQLCEGMPADGYDPTKLEAAVLDLAQVGFTVERVLDVIPESDPEIFCALASLSDAGLIRIEG
jgi:Tfp pilus assembly protein PilZ